MVFENYKYMVSIRCMTFNQSKYIFDALNGFVIQRTNFPYVIMVMDDASTDGEQEIIKDFISKQFNINDTIVAYEKETEYAHIIYAQHATNSNCYITALFLKENHYSQRKGKLTYLSEWRDKCKYEAICEGDDYWIDPLKLQKQVDFLERNPNYGLVCSEINLYKQESNTLHYTFFKKKKKWKIKYTFDDFIINAWFLAPCTWLYRIEFVTDEIESKKFIIGDLPLLLNISGQSKVKFMDEPMAVYRELLKSASHGFNFMQQVKYRKGVLRIQSYYIGKFNKQHLAKKILCRWALIMAKIAYNYKEYLMMFSYIIEYVKYCLHLKADDLDSVN